MCNRLKADITGNSAVPSVFISHIEEWIIEVCCFLEYSRCVGYKDLVENTSCYLHDLINEVRLRNNETGRHLDYLDLIEQMLIDGHPLNPSDFNDNSRVEKDYGIQQ